MTEVKNEDCGCTGIRNCLLCCGDKFTQSLSQSTSTNTLVLWFCPTCKGTYEGDISELIKENTLFWCKYHKDVPSKRHIKGIYVYEDFINIEEELYLYNEISKNEWKLSQSGRRKQDFGPKANFKRKKLKVGSFTGLPSFSKFLVERMNTYKILNTFQPVELCNLEYTPERGSSIDPHIDDVWLWGEQLVTVNLQSRTILTLSEGKKEVDLSEINMNKSKKFNCSSRNVELQIPMSRRSLLVLEDEARTKWLHAIKPCHIINERFAMTFRNLSLEFETNANYFEIRDKVKNIAYSFTGNVVT